MAERFPHKFAEAIGDALSERCTDCGRRERICSRCGCEYVSDRLCPGSNYTLMCRDPVTLPDSKEET